MSESRTPIDGDFYHIAHRDGRVWTFEELRDISTPNGDWADGVAV